jgi:hypothetical protein
LIKRKKLFAVDLTETKFHQSDPGDPLKIDVYSTIYEIPQNDYNQLKSSMGPGRSKPFLNIFSVTAHAYGFQAWAEILSVSDGLKKADFRDFLYAPSTK